MDWIARKRDWRQFFRFREGLGQQLGTAYCSRLLADVDLAVAQRKAGLKAPKNPPLRGFTPVMHALTDIADLILKVNSADPRKVEGLPRPLTAEHRLRDRKRRRNVDEITAKALGQTIPLFDELDLPIGGD